MVFDNDCDNFRTIELESINLRFKLKPDSSLYDDAFWDKVESGAYEPDTLFTLKRYVTANTAFFDVGAAAGVMTLVAASLGAKCISYEPVERWFNSLKKNIDCNPKVREQIVSKQSIVSNIEKSAVALHDQVGLSISSIVYPENLGEVSSVVDLRKEILDNCKVLYPLVKLDIEGAEYMLLRDKELLQILQEKSAIVILAIHPGFFRPMSKRKKLLTLKLNKFVFIFRNYIDNYKLYKNLVSYCTVKRSNDVEVLSAHKFCTMAAAGVYEYNLYF